MINVLAGFCGRSNPGLHQSCPPPLTSDLSSGIYLLDMIYIDSAYPASDGIMETEQRTNQMNNLLRVMSDQQMSCNYGRKPVVLVLSSVMVRVMVPPHFYQLYQPLEEPG